MSKLRYAATIFLGAFLLFQVQPMLAKAILPWFGGTPAVWTTCMLFFQLLLFGGYAYSHLLAGRLTIRAQVRGHAVLLGLSLLFLRVLPAARWRPDGTENPVPRIILLLAATIGLPYLVLATTSPLLQSWFRLEHPGRSPYRLYALSNFGSLLALVGYPFLIEPHVPLQRQGWLWAGLYVTFALGVIWCGWAASRLKSKESGEPGSTPVEPAPAQVPAERPRSRSLSDLLMWIGLAACGSVLLLATTNQLSQDVSVVPFLWVVPLALYLLSFIICFERDRWYWRPLWLGLFPFAAAAAFWAMDRGIGLPLPRQVFVYGSALFVGCMVCHGELARMRPGSERLTSFYLSVAAGGAAGGVFVGMIAPAVFPGMWEFPFVWPLIALAALLALYRDPRSRLRRGRPLWAWVPIGLIVLGLGWSSVARLNPVREETIAVVRDFYGVIKVKRTGVGNAFTIAHSLMHGRIQHGFQFAIGSLRTMPVSYYGESTGIGLAMRTIRDRAAALRPLEVGVVGLGAGHMAAWGRKGDVITFYEINPDIVKLTERYFTYLQDTPAEVKLVMGDARLSLEREAAEGRSKAFDLLALDAFSGDAIPLHLLTKEAFAAYWDRLKPDGVLAVHISNHYLNLGPLVRGLAGLSGREALRIENFKDTKNGSDASTWILVTNSRVFLDDPAVRSITVNWRVDEAPIVFTDAFSNLFELLR